MCIATAAGCEPMLLQICCSTLACGSAALCVPVLQHERATEHAPCACLPARLPARPCRNVVKAGGGRLVAPGSAAGSSSGRVDLAIASPADAGQLAALAAGGALVASPLFVVEWLAQPRASLARHALRRR